MSPLDALFAAAFITAAVGFFALAVEQARHNERLTLGALAFGFLGCVWVVAAGVVLA